MPCRQRPPGEFYGVGEVKGERRVEQSVLVGRPSRVGWGAERGREPERGGWERGRKKKKLNRQVPHFERDGHRDYTAC